MCVFLRGKAVLKAEIFSLVKPSPDGGAKMKSQDVFHACTSQIPAKKKYFLFKRGSFVFTCWFLIHRLLFFFRSTILRFNLTEEKFLLSEKCLLD